MSVTSPTGPNASASSSFMGALPESDDLGKEEFLMLLVTQLQYQDPLDPMDDKEFIAQLAQFTALEQQMVMTASMDNLVAIQMSQQRISAATYIGREVSALGSDISVEQREGEVDDEGEPLGAKISLVQYLHDGTLQSPYSNIFDADGQLVATVTLPNTSSGIHDFQWDGLLTNGNKAPDGVYSVAMAGKDAAGEPVMIDTSVTGVVTGVMTYEGKQILKLDDGRMVALDYVREVMTITEEAPKTDGDGDGGDGDGGTGDGGTGDGGTGDGGTGDGGTGGGTEQEKTPASSAGGDPESSRVNNKSRSVNPPTAPQAAPQSSSSNSRPDSPQQEPAPAPTASQLYKQRY